MDLKELYSALGGDYEETLGRLMNEKIMGKFILKFPGDKSFEELEQAMTQNDLETAFRAAHTLKGVCLNLGMTGLFTPSNALTDMLRPQNIAQRDPEKIAEMFEQTKAKYAESLAAIKAYEEGQGA